MKTINITATVEVRVIDTAIGGGVVSHPQGDSSLYLRSFPCTTSAF